MVNNGSRKSKIIYIREIPPNYASQTHKTNEVFQGFELQMSFPFTTLTNSRQFLKAIFQLTMNNLNSQVHLSWLNEGLEFKNSS